MQALGGYQGGKLLFLGFGTGLGTAMIVDGVLVPMELAHLPYRKATFEDYVGEAALDRFGKKKWRKYVKDVVTRLMAALEPEAVATRATSRSATCRRAAGWAPTATPFRAGSACGPASLRRKRRPYDAQPGSARAGPRGNKCPLLSFP